MGAPQASDLGAKSEPDSTVPELGPPSAVSDEIIPQSSVSEVGAAELRRAQ